MFFEEDLDCLPNKSTFTKRITAGQLFFIETVPVTLFRLSLARRIGFPRVKIQKIPHPQSNCRLAGFFLVVEKEQATLKTFKLDLLPDQHNTRIREQLFA